MSEYTYEKRLGERNVDQLPSKVDGKVYEWYTKNGIPMIWPDQFEGVAGYENLAVLPEGIETINFEDSFEKVD